MPGDGARGDRRRGPLGPPEPHLDRKGKNEETHFSGLLDQQAAVVARAHDAFRDPGDEARQMLVIGEPFPHRGHRGGDQSARPDLDALAVALRLDAEIFGRAPRRDLDREEHGHDTRNAPRLHAFYVITAPSPSMTMA